MASCGHGRRLRGAWPWRVHESRLSLENEGRRLGVEVAQGRERDDSDGFDGWVACILREGESERGYKGREYVERVGEREGNVRGMSAADKRDVCEVGEERGCSMEDVGERVGKMKGKF